MLVDFCVVNTSSTPLEISVGGDYRGSSRSLRFKVEVRDKSGALLPDPDPEPVNFGGLGYSPKIAPGDKWCQSLPLVRYARVDAPGTYAVTATHDLGWSAPAPRGSASVTFVEPTAADAERVVAAMEKLPADPETSAGKTSVDYQDYSTLRYDAYVTPLSARAGHDVRAIAGLAEIPTENATRALVSLLGSTNADVARAAARGLAMRLPDPALTGALGKRNPFENAMTPQRKYLSAHAWSRAFEPDVRSAAKSRLTSADSRDQADGAFMLEAVGTPAEGLDLTKALDAAIERTRTVPAETDIYPVPRGACQELLRAAEMLVARGLAPSASPKTPGEIAVWLVALGRAKPRGWEAELERAMKHAIPYVRELALDHAPTGLPASLVPVVASDLAHADADVVVSAAQLAEREHVASLANDVVRAMGKQKGLRLNIVSNAAYALGARKERVDALIALLGKSDTFDEAMSELVGLLDSHGRSSSGEVPAGERPVLAARWKAWAGKHAAEIRAGTKLPVESDLVPSSWKLE